MSEKVVYEFEGFRLDLQRRVLSRDGELIALRAIAFDLLVALVRNAGESKSKSELVAQLWGPNYADAGNFNVTLHTVRRALSDSTPPSLIIRDGTGYRLTAEVRICADTEFDHLKRSSDRHRHLVFVSTACVAYAALYVVALLLEVAFQFNRFAFSSLKVAPVVFGWILLTAIISLVGGRALTSQSPSSGIVVSTFGFFAAALVLVVFLTRFLPDSPVTQATFQTYPARAAYLKDVSQFLLLAFIFLILPLHFISSIENEVKNGRYRGVLDLLQGNKHAAVPRGAVYLRFWVLVCSLAIIAAILLITTAHLLENLKLDPNLNLFIELLYVKGILYLGMGLTCLTWYYLTLSSIKRVCLARIVAPSSLEKTAP